MGTFTFASLVEQLSRSNDRYLEILAVPTMSVGVYVLTAGTKDEQKPHTEDEVYYIVSGIATLNVSGEDQPVQPGSIVFVAANEPHWFHNILEDLTILVVFAPARGSEA